MGTVFYSWQSDTPNNVNRGFIRDALDKAIKKVNKTLEVEDADREDKLKLDQDTAGVPGMPEIANTIFRKIEKCSIFIPDLTFVGNTEIGKKKCAH